MSSTFNTPGVYIEEKNAFPGSAVAVATAVPVFIGFTEKAMRDGKSILGKPTRITSLAEFEEYFGRGFVQRFSVTAAASVKAVTEDDAPPLKLVRKSQVSIDGRIYEVACQNGFELYLYNCMRHFYLNGGADCYVLAVKTYAGEPEQRKRTEGFAVQKAHFTGGTVGTEVFENVFGTLMNEQEPSLVVMPDLAACTDPDDAYDVYTTALQHCEQTQSRFLIADVMHLDQKTDAENIAAFRNRIGINALKWGAAYYPWLETSVVQPVEVNFTFLSENTDLTALFPDAVTSTLLDAGDKTISEILRFSRRAAEAKKAKETDGDEAWLAANLSSLIENLHRSLSAKYPGYVDLMTAVRSCINTVPPSAAMAGIYTMVDSTRGVWKAPANVSVAAVNKPLVNISAEAQQSMNIDAITGKSVNAIRPFNGLGTLVWGARTLDGNSQDWRYINVRRTLIMIEQSLKLATRSYVFEPNDSSTWISVQSMIDNFLYNLWKQGALAGAVPEQAYDTQIGLGTTMTANDILDGKMLITVKVAVVRPAEFIVITFQQQQQQS